MVGVIRKKSGTIGVILIFISICIAYFIGLQIKQENNSELLISKFPEVKKSANISNDLFQIGESPNSLKYFCIGEDIGYGGPLKVVVVADNKGYINHIEVLDHKETESYLQKVIKNRYMEEYPGLGLDDHSQIVLVNGISGATITCDAIRLGVLKGIGNLSEVVFGTEFPDPGKPEIKIGISEVLLLLLFIFGILVRKNVIKNKKTARWISLITGLIVFGFINNNTLTIGKLNTFLLGYQSYWQNNIFWYLLIFGIILILIFTNKNSYCNWFCPFGSAQDCLGAIGKAEKIEFTGRRKILNFLPGFLSWLVILLALIFRNPRATSYEVFGAFFNVTGSVLLFIILAIILIMSLFIKRPWCNYLCPVSPVFKYIRKVRNLIVRL